jgi:hypothetical protein
MMKTFAEKAIEFYAGLQVMDTLPDDVEVLNPYKDPQVKSIVKDYFRKFYNDNKERVGILGINPGRFGAGVTGITFTDPLRLEQDCKIPNTFDKRSELSSRFVYDVIQSYGGARKFFGKFFLSAVSPLGFIKARKNLNYYDEKKLEEALKEFILNTLKMQSELGLRRDKLVCLGEGKNYKYLQKINRETGLFAEIIPLPHPRWVMQYRFRQKEEFILAYLDILNNI